MSEELSTAERLAVLQALDHHRTWHSLNDRRLCVRCAKPFNGLEIHLCREPDGSYHASCPTPGCDSLPKHWLFYGTDSHSGSAVEASGEVDFASW
jgi:hypothetical protein